MEELRKLAMMNKDGHTGVGDVAALVEDEFLKI